MELMERWKHWTGRDEDEDMSAAWALPEGNRPARSDREFSVRATTRLRVTIAQPKRLEDVPAVAEELKSGMTVILNLEGVDRGPMCRILDVLSGVAYALDAAISRIAANTYMIVPFNVEFEGGLMDALTSGGVFDSELEY